MSGDDISTDKISPEMALLMIEEGFGILVDNLIYQGNPGIYYFNYRKWRNSEDYTLKNEGRNKIYYLSGRKILGYMKREEFLEKVKNEELYVVIPIGQNYTINQRKRIEKDKRRIINILRNFI